jgi:hypothetical protein
MRREVIRFGFVDLEVSANDLASAFDESSRNVRTIGKEPAAGDLFDISPLPSWIRGQVGELLGEILAKHGPTAEKSTVGDG